MAKLIQIGASGPEVGKIQQMLIEAGESIDHDELQKAHFGPSTKAAVVDFQSSHLDAKNKPLGVDGIVGDFTLKALANPRLPVEKFIADGWRGEVSKAPNPDAASAVSIAIAEIGNKEDPLTPNWGPMVKKYGQKWDPENLQYQAWCAYFVSYCWKRAPIGSPFGVKASALKIKDWGMEHKCLVPNNEPVLPGDIAVLIRAEGRGHVGIVTATEFDDKIGLVEGNCGNAVRATVRERKFWSHFVRPR